MARLKPTEKIIRYGLMWPALQDALDIERYMIQHGGQWKLQNGGTAGSGLAFHYKAMMKLLWPEEDQHRWFNLIVDEWTNNLLTCVSGCKDSGKSHTMSMIALADYYCFPMETLALVSSTDIRGLELRIWGDMKSLHSRAQSRYEDLPGYLIDSKHCICTDNLEEDEVRDLRRGIICIPCVGSSGQWVGLGKYVGIKQKRRRLYADETQFMKQGFMDSLANLNSGDFKGMFSGNPLGDGDPLDKLSEPKGGWSSLPEPQKTTVWDTRDTGGRCINLVGTDSPNFDYPQDEEPRFPYLINKKAIDRVLSRYKENTFQYLSQCKGVRMTGLDAFKVLTRELCLQHHALEPVYWRNEKRTKVYAVDAAYGNIGGDRCIGGWIEFGYDVTDKLILSVNPPVTIPVKPASMANGVSPEDQIAQFARDDCERQGIPPGNVFHDATGRGSLGTSFARIWSADVNPIEFGGKPSERPVTSELTTLDHTTGHFRLMRANEHYSKFVSELWFSVRYVVESGQMRNLPTEVMDEFCRRIWRMVLGNKIEVEPKSEMKERTGESPDLADFLCTAVEGARRLGFSISRMAAIDFKQNQEVWKKDLYKRAIGLQQRHQLNYKV